MRAFKAGHGAILGFVSAALVSCFACSSDSSDGDDATQGDDPGAAAHSGSPSGAGAPPGGHSGDASAGSSGSGAGASGGTAGASASTAGTSGRANTADGGRAGNTGVAGGPAAGAPSSLPGPVGRWEEIETPTGDTIPDVHPIKLTDGSVLLVGGFGARVVFRFLPDDGTVETLGLLPEERGNFAAALLDDGRVLVVGGNSPNARDGLTSCLLYDPEDDSWSPAAELPERRARQAAVKLPDGNVLVAGGVGPGVGGVPVKDVYRYVVDEDRWEVSGPLAQPASFHRLFPVAGNAVLVVADNPQLYDLGTEGVIKSSPLTRSRRDARAVQLPNGSVLAIGGEPFSIEGMSPFDVADEYSPTDMSFSARAPLSVPRGRPGAVTLEDGTVLVAGGFASYTASDTDPAQKSAERYVPSVNAWYAEAPVPIATGGDAILLDDGSVLFVNNYLTRFYPEPWQ